MWALKTHGKGSCPTASIEVQQEHAGTIDHCRDYIHLYANLG